MNDELRPIGPGRYAVTLAGPWGQPLPAEVIVTTARGWSERPEARDPRWAVFPYGPAVVALRVLGPQAVPIKAPPTAKPAVQVRPEPVRLPCSPVPAEWN